MCSSLLLCCILCVSYAHSVSYVRVDPLVKIEQGLISGEKSADGTYSMFLGVPYAMVDPLKPFGLSKPAPTFTDVFRAVDGTKKCPQSVNYEPDSSQNRDETLDCLRLNIYVPSKAGSRNPLPVLVWIHGGGFLSGSAGDLKPKSLLKENIVVVTINYRLGAYGFLCLDTPSVPGNQGLKDQYEALRWIKNNIAAFGGNPYKVTLGGQGSGSIAALLHLNSPRTKLFHRIIAQSGVPSSYMLDKDYDAAIKLANYLGNNTTNTEEALGFLENTPFDLVSRAVTATKIILGPCGEKSYSGIENFLDTNPYMAINAKNIKDTPILLGHTNKEIPGFVEYQPSSDPFTLELKKNFDFNNDSEDDSIDNVRHFYIGDAAVDINVADKIGDFESDFKFNHPTQRLIEDLLKEKSSAIYEYVFSYVGNAKTNTTEEKYAVHASEMPYLFDGLTIHTNNETLHVTQNIAKLWANFVKYGNPTPSLTGQEQLHWPPVTTQKRPFLVIDSELYANNSRVYNDRMAFWDLFYRAYGKRHKLYRDCD